MIKRLLPPALLLCSTVPLAACPSDDGPSVGEGREPYVDDWEMVASGPAAQLTTLSIGDRLAQDNYANRGDIEVRYVSGTDQVTIEMQRFTIAKNEEDAAAAFGRMKFWGYDLSSPEPPAEDNADRLCWAPDTSSCYARVYYEGMIQPTRDGANFRVTIPVGWEGNLALTTSDNLGEGIDSYPDRSDVLVDGLAGDLAVDMDSGNLQVKMDPNTKHYALCPTNDECVAAGHEMGCGCNEPTNISVENGTGQSSNMTVDVSNPDSWYTVILENRGSFSSGSDFVCNATIDCSAFNQDACVIDPDYASMDAQERAEINYPGVPAINGAGIRVQLVSDDCANIRYVTGVDDFEAESFPEEKRGELLFCVGCLDDL